MCCSIEYTTQYACFASLKEGEFSAFATILSFLHSKLVCLTCSC